MEAPDKLYISIQDLGSGYAYDLSLDNNGEQEYIRKDALMEWAEETKAELENQNVIKDDIRKGAVWELEEVINKLNSM